MFDIPVIVYQEGTELPATGNYYVVAGNGLYLHKDSELFSGFVPVNSISILPELTVDQKINCTLPKFNAREVSQVKRFFQQVFSKHHSEACILVYYNRVRKKYMLDAPWQYVTPVSVGYDIVSYKDCLLVGTIHSHCNFDAFHSSIDEQDEQFSDGLHITFGNVNEDEFTISASLVMNGRRDQVDPTLYLEVEPFNGRYKLMNNTPPPESWMRSVNFGKRPSVWLGDKSNLKTGDQVLWSENIQNNRDWSSTYGQGPFQVLDVFKNSGGMMVKIEMPVRGDKIFPISFFQKHKA